MAAAGQSEGLKDSLGCKNLIGTRAHGHAQAGTCPSTKPKPRWELHGRNQGACGFHRGMGLGRHHHHSLSFRRSPGD